LRRDHHSPWRQGDGRSGADADDLACHDDDCGENASAHAEPPDSSLRPEGPEVRRFWRVRESWPLYVAPLSVVIVEFSICHKGIVYPGLPLGQTRSWVSHLL
jgi:hypothetical protein